MENKDQQIRDLCKMFGDGYNGPVEWTVLGGTTCEGADCITFHLLTSIDFWLRHDYIKDIHIPPRPFTDLLVKDAVGITDADRIARIEFPQYFGPASKIETDYGSITVFTEGEEMRFDFTIMEGYSMYCIKKSHPANEYHARSITGRGFDFLRSKGYIIPDSLKSG